MLTSMACPPHPKPIPNFDTLSRPSARAHDVAAHQEGSGLEQLLLGSAVQAQCALRGRQNTCSQWLSVAGAKSEAGEACRQHARRQRLVITPAKGGKSHKGAEASSVHGNISIAADIWPLFNMSAAPIATLILFISGQGGQDMHSACYLYCGRSCSLHGFRSPASSAWPAPRGCRPLRCARGLGSCQRRALRA